LVRYAEFEYDPAQRESFRRGELAQRWATDFPAVFDADDLRLAASQPRAHYFEWLAAIRVFEENGYLSLIEKYQFKRHARKYTIFTSLVPQSVVRLFSSRYLGADQAPDLLCYASDMQDWFFCEVKGGHDRARATQSRDFTILEKMSGRPVRLIHFRSKPSPLKPGTEPDAA
jgi:hypothetical protein